MKLNYIWQKACKSLIFLGLFTVVVSACGNPTDDPTDCTANQYFDDLRQLCIRCPAIQTPQCDRDCGTVITTDENACPVAECIEQSKCQFCPADKFLTGEPPNDVTATDGDHCGTCEQSDRCSQDGEQKLVSENNGDPTCELIQVCQ